MQLNDDGDSLDIFKKVPLKKMYVRSADDTFLQREKLRIKNERIEQMRNRLDMQRGFENEQELNN